MKTILLHTLMALMAVSVLSACDMTEDGYKPIDESFFRLDVSTTSLNFGCSEGSTAEIKIYTTVYWEIECQDPHFKFSQIYGQGDATITVTADANNTRKLLASTFKILVWNSDYSGLGITIDMEQAPFVFDATASGVKELVSESGKKKWRWMPTNVNGGGVWGNGGYLAGEQDGGLDINGAWWGCGPIDGVCEDTFEDMTQHAGGHWPEVKGECYNLSYMEFSEDGSLVAYSNEDVKINEGFFSISNYDNNKVTNEATFSRGTLTTTAGAILWPFQINSGGNQPTDFEIGYLDASHMVLIYAPQGTGGWSECTWWSFGN